VVIITAIPSSIIITIILNPVWSWLEMSTGIESMGHAGPAEWCYMLIFFLLILGATIIILISKQHRQKNAANKNENNLDK
jgi:predicted PurR-regulated permease PerM